MPLALRLQAEKALSINGSWLSPKIGCGLMLAKMPNYSADEVLRDVMRNYGYSSIRADKQAAKFLDTHSDLLQSFCANAEGAKMPIEVNYKTVFGSKDLILVTDSSARTAYFVAAAENKLALNNYFRDAMPGLLQSMKLTLGGSTSRLTPIGWQNLHDLLTLGDFRFDFPDVERLEIMASLPAARWRKPVLEVGVNMLNFQEVRVTREALIKEYRQPKR
ncbi:MAG: hypothetical protein ABIK62_07445 [candidate division WOR-3 bacterium]